MDTVDRKRAHIETIFPFPGVYCRCCNPSPTKRHEMKKSRKTKNRVAAREDIRRQIIDNKEN
jgi:hypothetical protein